MIWSVVSEAGIIVLTVYDGSDQRKVCNAVSEQMRPTRCRYDVLVQRKN